MMKISHSFLLLLLVAALSLPSAIAQSSYNNDDYNDDYQQSSSQQDGYYGAGGDADEYAQDNLYANYASQKEQVANGGAGGRAAWTSIAAGGVVGWLVGGKFHTRRLQKKLEAKHKKDQKALYKQYYQDVYTLQQQNAELLNALEQYGFKIR